MIEYWKPIPDTGDLYEASSLGRIRSKDRIIDRRSRWGGMIQIRKPGRVLKPWSDAKGYLCVYTCFDGNRIAVNVHRLVARAFLDGDGDGLDVNHKDGDKTNNRPENLEWATRSENMRHAQAVGLWNNRKAIIGRPKDGGCPIRFISLREAAAHVGANNTSSITQAAQGKYTQAHGFVWEYAEAA